MELENISIKESKLTTILTTDAIIFRREYEKYRKDYLTYKKEETLIFCFIFLQLYIEYHLHEYIREIINFSNMDKTKWNKYESSSIPEKLNELTKLLFPKNCIPFLSAKKELISNYNDITFIRNKLVHGHAITSISNNCGNKEISETKAMLTKQKFDEIVRKANKICKYWNVLLDIISLNHILPEHLTKDFKLNSFE